MAISEIKKINIDGNISPFLSSDMYREISFSPDGKYLLVSKIKRPFSYLVPYYRFPNESNIYKSDGSFVTKVNDVPLDEVRPKGFMAERVGKRDMIWRDDQPATLVWAEVLDNGDPEIDVAYRDAIYQLPAPFNSQPKLLLKTKQRFSNIDWGNDNVAIAYDMWWNTRNTKTYLFNPSNYKQEPKVITDRSYQDVYSDPGDFVTKKNEYGRYVLEMEGDNLYLMGPGYSDKGQFPFIDEYNIKTNKTNRIYQSEYTDKLENLNRAINMNKGDILVRIESQTEYPNYYIRNIKKKNDLSAITAFENPFKSLENINKVSSITKGMTDWT